MIEHAWKVRSHQRIIAAFSALVSGWCGVSAGLPSWGQAPMPPAIPAQEAANSVVNPFYTALEGLSQKYGVAFVAEGRPFPQTADKPVPALNTEVVPEAGAVGTPPKDLSPEEREVQEVAARFDYSIVHQDNVYLLKKRYSNPEDMPDVTPAECRNGLKAAKGAFPGGVFASNFARNPEEALAIVLFRGGTSPTKEQWARMGAEGVPLTELSEYVQHTAWMTAYRFYYQTFQDRIDGTFVELDERPPVDPPFHWKNLDIARVFGYDTLAIDFIPLSDADRVRVPSYKAPMPRAGFWVREDIHVPAQDPTDPANLSMQAKQFLDDDSNSSHAVSLEQAITALNHRSVTPGLYDVDAMYAPKHVTLVGVDQLAPQVVMQSLADVYGLRVSHRDGKTVLTAPLPIHPTAFTDVKRALLSAIPAPIYRAFRLRTVPTQNPPAPADGMPPPGSPESAPPSSPLLDACEAHGTEIHNTALQMFRYLAEPKITAASGRRLPLSRLGERASDLFQLARMAHAYTDLCALVDNPPPPYLVDLGEFPRHVTLNGSGNGNANADARVQLYLTYTDPKTGEKYGPLKFFDSRIPRVLQRGQ